MSIEFSWNEIKPIRQIESTIENECRRIYMWRLFLFSEGF